MLQLPRQVSVRIAKNQLWGNDDTRTCDHYGTFGIDAHVTSNVARAVPGSDYTDTLTYKRLRFAIVM